MAAWKDRIIAKTGTSHLEDVEVDESRVRSALLRGNRRLEQSQDDDGCIGFRRWDVWETSHAVLALLSAGYDRSTVQKSIGLILEHQLDEGGFTFTGISPMSMPPFYCVETTSVALIAVYRHAGRIVREVKKAIDFLIKKQEASGGWALPFIPEPSNLYPSITGYALLGLATTDSLPGDTLDKALAFLEETQKSDGSWGRNRHYYSTEGYAIHSISTALSLIRERNLAPGTEAKIDRILGACSAYVHQQQNLDGSWSSKGPSSKILTTALFLESQLATGYGDRPGLALNWLLEKQEADGYWKGGTLDCDNVDTFATAHVLIALRKYLDKHSRC
jgi:squalene cyclase